MLYYKMKLNIVLSVVRYTNVFSLHVRDITRLSSYAWGVNQGCYPTREGNVTRNGGFLSYYFLCEGDIKVVILYVYGDINIVTLWVWEI